MAPQTIDLEFIPVNQPLLNGNEKAYVLECLETGWISSDGPFVSRFEEAFSQRVGRQHGVAVANGSGALDIAVQALKIGPGDEVIMPTFTIISPAASVVRSGATPVFVDCDPYTWNIDVSQIESRITSRTAAILVVHIYGLPTDMDPILRMCDQYGLALIEDAAEMHGQTYRGRPCGSFGAISTFSFYANKHVTTGEGGMLVTNDAVLAERCRSLRNLCFQPERRFVHSELGWNYRFTNIQAALGLAQLERLDETVARKRQIGRAYNDQLTGMPQIQRPLLDTEYAENIFWVYGVCLASDLPFDAAEAMRRFASRKIGTRPFFWPMHEQPVFREMGIVMSERHPVAERLARRGLYFPSGAGLTDDQIERCASAARSLLGA